eukprot:g7678.t1
MKDLKNCRIFPKPSDHDDHDAYVELKQSINCEMHSNDITTELRSHFGRQIRKAFCLESGIIFTAFVTGKMGSVSAKTRIQENYLMRGGLRAGSICPACKANGVDGHKIFQAKINSPELECLWCNSTFLPSAPPKPTDVSLCWGGGSLRASKISNSAYAG